jgi:NADPH2:quinone reductase
MGNSGRRRRGEGERDYLPDLGADVVVDYRTGDLASHLGEVTGGIDVALESHADANLRAEIETVRRGGRGVVIGEDDSITLDSGVAMTAKQANLDVRFMSLAASRGDQSRLLGAVGPLLADGSFEARIDSRFPIDDAREAFRRLGASGRRGRVVVVPDAGDPGE